MLFTSNDTVTKVKVDDDCNVEITAKSGYCKGVDKLCSLENNGNGYFVRFYSYVSTEADHIFNLDYSEIEAIYFAYKAILKKKKKGKV